MSNDQFRLFFGVTAESNLRLEFSSFDRKSSRRLDGCISVPSVGVHGELLHGSVDGQAVALATVPVVGAFLIHDLDLSAVGEL